MACNWGSKSLFLGLLICFVLSFSRRVHGQNIWPMPNMVSSGSSTLYLSANFQLMPYSSSYLDSSGILKEAFERMVQVIKAGHAPKTDFADAGVPDFTVLTGINISIWSPNDTLKFEIDESYYLFVPDARSPSYARIEATTVFGALHALETFSQLCYFNFTTKMLELHSAPWTISDMPRFPYRGLLIDTSRHYLPVPVIKSVIDSMAYSKLNVLHWHIVDDQSFPIEIPSYPKLWKGSYSESERYTMEDAAEIVKYAERRGVNVLAEIDVPGHTTSWGIGYPSLWPENNCRNPLDVTNEFAFEIIDSILSDFSKVFKFKFIHLGGDEVFMDCWNKTQHIKEWLNDRNMTLTDGYRYFVLRAENIANSHGYDVINWEETFINFGDKLSRNTVVQNWLHGGLAQEVVASGLRCIVSDQGYWYLDHVYTSWESFYSYEPLTNISDPDQQKLVLGGEVCMWGEQIDTSNIQRTIWPRAAAAAERLWTAVEKLVMRPVPGAEVKFQRLLSQAEKLAMRSIPGEEVKSRLAHFRCLLNQRGIEAAPLDGNTQNAPQETGSCFDQ